MNRLPSISALSGNHAGWGYFLCADKSLRSGRGGDFLALTLQDGTGTLIGRIFDNLERLTDEFEAGEFVKAQGRTNLFNGRLQFVIESIRRVMLGPDSQDRRDGFREETLLPVSRRPLDEMWAELQQVVAAIGNPHLRVLVGRIVAQSEAKLRIWPAALTAPPEGRPRRCQARAPEGPGARGARSRALAPPEHAAEPGVVAGELTFAALGG